MEHNLHLMGTLLEEIVAPEALAVAPPGFSAAQLSALRFIGNNPGVTPGVAAKALGVAAPSATAMLQRLAKKGWVEKRASPEDHRATQLLLTASGKALLAAIERRHQALLADLIKEMPADAIAQLQTGVESMLNAARKKFGANRLCRHCGHNHTDTCLLVSSEQVDYKGGCLDEL